MSYSLRWTILGVFLLGRLLVSAQENTYGGNASHQMQYGLQIDAAYASTLNNAMLFASGFVDQDLKDENYNRLNDVNRSGTYADAKLFFRQMKPELWGIKNLGYYFAVEAHYLDEYMFGKDLYQLVLYGNKDFAGEYACLANSAEQLLNYYQIKGGLFKESDNGKHQFGANLAFNMGNRLRSFYFYEPATFLTNLTGTELTLDASRVTYDESDTARTQWYQMNGYGAGLDVFYEFRKKAHYSLRLSVENFGFIHWNDQSFSFDGSLKEKFIGLETNSLFAASNENQLDTLVDYLYQKTDKGTKGLFIPTDIKVEYRQFLLSKKIETTLKVHYRLFSYMLPLAQLDATYAINEGFKLGPVLSYGGYAGFNAGLKLELVFAKNYYLQLETRYLTGLAQHSFSGVGGFINFTYKINRYD